MSLDKLEPLREGVHVFCNLMSYGCLLFFFFQAEDGIRDWSVTGVQTCALPIYSPHLAARRARAEFYLACAETDRHAPLEMVGSLRQSLREGGVNAEVELYPGVEQIGRASCRERV